MVTPAQGQALQLCSPYDREEIFGRPSGFGRCGAQGGYPICKLEVSESRLRRSDAGQGMVIVGLAMVALMGAAGLAVDLGYLPLWT